MRFLVLTQYFKPETGAAPQRLDGIIRSLIRLGYQIEVLTSMPNAPMGRIFDGYRNRLYCREQMGKVTVHRVWLYASNGTGMRRLVNFLSFAATVIAGLLKTSKCDLIFVESPPPLVGLAAIIASKRYGVPMVFNVADLWPDTARDFGWFSNNKAFGIAEAFEKWIYRRSDVVSAVTEGIFQRLIQQKGVPESKVVFLPNGVDVDLYKPINPEWTLKEQLGLIDKDVVVYPGTMGTPHSAESFLRAADLLRKTSVHFLFIGSGSAKPKLLQQTKELKLGNVSFLDPVPAEDIPKWLSIAKCGLVSVRKASILEGARPAKMFPIMACAKPVVYAGTGEGADILRRACGGLTVPVDNPATIAQGIRTLVDDSTLAATLGQNGREYVIANFSWESLIANWLEQLSAALPVSMPSSLKRDLVA